MECACRNDVKIVTSQPKCSKEPNRTFYTLRIYVQWRSTLVLYFFILIFVSEAFHLSYPLSIYSYFEKGCGKKCHATIPRGNIGYNQQHRSWLQLSNLRLLLSFSSSQTHVHGLSCHSFNFIYAILYKIIIVFILIFLNKAILFSFFV